MLEGIPLLDKYYTLPHKFQSTWTGCDINRFASASILLVSFYNSLLTPSEAIYMAGDVLCNLLSFFNI